MQFGIVKMLPPWGVSAILGLILITYLVDVIVFRKQIIGTLKLIKSNLNKPALKQFAHSHILVKRDISTWIMTIVCIATLPLFWYNYEINEYVYSLVTKYDYSMLLYDACLDLWFMPVVLLSIIKGPSPAFLYYFVRFVLRFISRGLYNIEWQLLSLVVMAIYCLLPLLFKSFAQKRFNFITLYW